jgi:hypothetical protein
VLWTLSICTIPPSMPAMGRQPRLLEDRSAISKQTDGYARARACANSTRA